MRLVLWKNTREEIVVILKAHYQETATSSLIEDDNEILNLITPCITEAENKELTAIPDEQEIKSNVFQIRAWSALGPDGFQAGFYQQNWEVVGGDVIKMVKKFFKNSKLLKELNHTFQTLIPKNNCVQNPSDFRPISLCNISYKIISKIMTNRLKPMLHKIISPWQATYVPGRNIIDNTVIAHEIVRYMKTTKNSNGAVAIKLDMSKDFDRMEWNFIINIFRKLGFSEKWCQLVNQCISTTSTSILLNGSPIETIHPTRGLRRGDSLCPYIFITCMEGLSRMIQASVDSKNIIPIYPAKGSPPISHLFFADDCILFSSAKMSFINNIKDITNKFCKASGQMVNLSKSSIHFNRRIEEEKKQQICNTMNMNIMPLEEKYLGINLL